MPEIKEKDQAVTEVKLAGEPAQEKPRTRKKASTKPEAPENTLPDDPEAAAKLKAEKLNALIEKGKKAGKLTSKELMDTLDDLKMEPDELDKFYDKLEDLGIDTAGDDILPPLDDDLPALEELQEIEEVTDEEIAAECKSWATYGKPADRQRNIVTSLELQSEKMEIINKRLQEKYKALEENEVRYEAIDCDDADYVIVAFGSSARICSASVEMARAEGLKVGLLRPITLYPFPKKPLAELAARGVKGFLSAELNAGQMVEDVRLAVNGAAPVEHFGRQGGMMFAPDEVLAALKEKLIKK